MRAVQSSRNHTKVAILENKSNIRIPCRVELANIKVLRRKTAEEKTESDDNRSYHINSDKIFKTLGYKPKRSIDDAVRDLCKAIKEGKVPNSFDDDIYFNVKRLLNRQAK